MRRVEDIHSRRFASNPAAVGGQLETLSQPDDDFWVTDLVPPMVLDNGLQPGSVGGHGAVRYSVIEHEPGRSVVFRFDQRTGLRGTHRFVIEQDGDDIIVRHELEAELSGAMRLLWKPLVLPIHSGVIEDIFDHLERSAGHEPNRQHPTRAPMRWIARRMAALETRG
ncbi:SRPBCC family protein [Lysinibacter cavernae]|uniref:SRPBCC family protein n=1 Tax=Lysinibacter cavernae TaxID=1640652 RepID=A0A7X5TSJ4_9MICO|nr:SRPBCC family protein [Lysinibacter cavernae]NIH52479.1 hypothetical protein [Lysinibacter cavernae]